MPRALAFALTFLVVSTGLAGLVAAASVTPEAKLDTALVGATAVTAANGMTYIFGGRDSGDAYSADVRMYDPGSKTITRVASFPTPVGGQTVGGSAGRYSGTAVAFGGMIYYFGGTQIVQADINGDGTNEPVPRALRDIFAFDPSTNTLDLLADRLPVGAWGMSGVATTSAIYLFGGFTFDLGDLPNTGRHDWVVRFDPNKAEGSTGSNGRVDELDTKLPYPVQDSAAAFLGRRVFIMGGLADHDPEDNPCPTYTYYDEETNSEQTAQIELCITKRIVVFDPSYDQESVIGVAGELPYRAQFISAAVVNNKAYVSGALLSDGSAAASIVEVSSDASSTPQTRVLTPALPSGTFGQAVATDGATVLLAGGRLGGSRELTDGILRLDPRATAPWAPRSATAAEIPGGGVRLTWEAPTYNGDSAITGYRVYRSGIGQAEERVTETTSLSFDDSGVRPGTEYAWRIVTVNAIGESVQSARVTRSSGVSTPGPVTAFAAYPGNNDVLLRWRAPEETGGSNITGYRVIRDGSILATTPPETTEYDDVTAQNGVTYAYQVVAYNAKGDGTLSATERVTPAAVPPAPANVAAEVIASGSGSAVRISWLEPAANVDRYLVYRSALPGRAGTVVGGSDEAITQTTFVDNVVERGRTYHYTVVSVNNVGQSPPSAESTVALVRKPGPPGELTAVGLDGETRLSWAPPIDTGDAPESALRYYVSRASPGSSARIIRTDLEGTTFIDRQVTPGQEYTYTVTTLNPMPSDPSAPASATPRVILNKPPTALLSILPPIADAGDPVELDATQSADVDGSIRTYLFDFGDGTDPVTTPQATVTHSYALNGTFTATVIATDDRGEVSEPASAQVIVGEVVSRNVDTGLPGRVPAGSNNPSRPGSSNPDVPGPGVPLVLLGVAVLALAMRRHRTR